MRKMIIALLFVSLIVATGLSVKAESVSQAGPGRPLDVAEAPINTVIDSALVGTPTLTLNGTATLIGTVPAGAHAVYICTASGPINFGNASIAVGIGNGIPVANQSYIKLNLRKDDVTPSIYVVNNATGTAGTKKCLLLFGK